MVSKRSPRENEVQSIGIIREKEDAVYFVTLIFKPGYGPVLILDGNGNPQLEGGDYEIKRATWSRYNTAGKGTYIKPDKPVTDWGEGHVTGCEVTYQDGEPVFMWD